MPYLTQYYIFFTLYSYTQFHIFHFYYKKTNKKATQRKHQVMLKLCSNATVVAVPVKRKYQYKHYSKFYELILIFQNKPATIL